MVKKGSWFSAIKRVFTPHSKEKLGNETEIKSGKEKRKKGFGKREPSSIEKILGEAARDHNLVFRPPTPERPNPFSVSPPLRPASPRAPSPRVASPRAASPKPPSPRAEVPRSLSPKLPSPRAEVPRSLSPKPHDRSKPSSASANAPPSLRPASTRVPSQRITTSSVPSPRPSSPRGASPQAVSSKSPSPRVEPPTLDTPRPPSPKPPSPRADPPRLDAPRPTTPKPPSPRVEPPTLDTPRPPSPKPPSPRADPPRLDAPRPTTPKPPSPRVEPPTLDTPRPPSPKPPSPRADPPRLDAPRPTTPKPPSPRVEPPTLDTPRPPSPKPPSPRADPPRLDAPRPTTPKPPSPRVEPPTLDTPRPPSPKPPSPRADPPRLDAPRPTTPKPPSPRVEPPTLDTPRPPSPKPPSPRADPPRLDAPRPTTPKLPSPRAVSPRAVQRREIVHRPEPTLSVQHASATKIQGAFRGFMARKSFRALKGLVRLQGVVRGYSVKRQTINAMKYMQQVVRVQSQIQSRRIKMLENQAQVEKDEAKWAASEAGNDNWDDSVLTKEERDARSLRKTEAIIKRERSMAYAYSRKLWKNSPKYTQENRSSGGFPQWWNWADRQHPLASPAPSYSQPLRDFRLTPSRLCPSPLSQSSKKHHTRLDNHFDSSTPRSSRSTLLTPSRHIHSGTSRYSRGRLIRGQDSPFKDDDSLTSCPPFPSYMAPTVSAKAKVRPNSNPKERVMGTPVSEKRRMSFPPTQQQGLDTFRWNKGSLVMSNSSSQRGPGSPGGVVLEKHKTLKSVGNLSIGSSASTVGRKEFNRFV
ncbi:PREDICTED: protein IQ-DOMAIN 14-like [Camelina sativa]|uniref:Protein IQ-DOMAIN 14-like n=1 Tax=Camelina sativa TaxID=90675 RepID=A0ABM0YUZ7_CAMSA|nr:PREDICTED: protein IQ-DOMAIN 14-like [Camelina sativa]